MVGTSKRAHTISASLQSISECSKHMGLLGEADLLATACRLAILHLQRGEASLTWCRQSGREAEAEAGCQASAEPHLQVRQESGSYRKS
jgi:hypothetical protein